MQYIIKETQNAQSEREGETIDAPNLAAAKRAATKAQFYQGTVLSIYVDSGAGVLDCLARKIDGRWTDYGPEGAPVLSGHR